ncbi:MAG: argininosuccinate lyase [Prevotella sp.]|nr:argininosuccinate lyase [Paraprevotella sp.]MCI6201025.1 argininosuccinate lyase [Paraprevotella sp.]MDD5855615.1 argininosuccinate lyase [Prevotella sp.]MDD7692388.1 argininosuccinate lyase [Prevotella sp.]MDY4407578.1 argininosuccinate lyase [Prevotella sp.]
MANKLWDKNYSINEDIDRFTVGRDREMDMFLAKYDVLGSMAHIIMLQSVGLLEKNELNALLAELKNIYHTCERGEFVIEDDVEDVHSQVEMLLTRRLGDIGKKIHSGRSRNDQVLVDLKLFTRHEIKDIVFLVKKLFDELLQKSEQYKDVLMPGYTHLQVAMPSSFGLWFGAYAESLADDMLFLNAAWRMTNRNPLGSAAGYGSSFPLNRQMTTDLLGFDTMDYNVVYAQMGRGKTERNVAFAMSTVAGTLSKLAFDACLFNSQNFSFVKLPKECTTGSSIMPHKKNPDVFELIRAKCNKIQSLPQQIMLIMNNLPSGYFRDLQIIKEIFLPAFDELKDCLQMAIYIISEMNVNKNILDNDMYNLMFSVEEVNRLAAEGMPFRDAYKKVGLDIEAGVFVPNKNISHTHEGSIGNLCNDKIAAIMDNLLAEFTFDKVECAEQKLLS